MGTERFTLDLARQMQKMSHYPTVVTYDPDKDRTGFESLTDHVLVKRYSYGTIPVIALKYTTGAEGPDVFYSALEEAVDKLQLDCELVHICHPMWLSSIAKVCKNASIPVVMTLTDSWLLCPRGLLDRGYRLCNGPDYGERCMSHCGLGVGIKLRYEESKALFEMVDEVATASRFLATLFRSNGWNRRFRIVPHSIDYANVRRVGKSHQGKIIFAFIGSMSWHKGVHVLIDAFRKVTDQNIALRIYGSSQNHSDYLRALLNLAKGDNRIFFLDPFKIEALPEIMEDIFVMVIPSTYYENYPLVMLMALAYRVPVIASKIGGIPEVVRDGFNGFLFERGDAEELSRVIERIAKEPGILERVKRNIVAPRRTEEEALDYENIYRKLA